jgi:hypothetical protein
MELIVKANKRQAGLEVSIVYFATRNGDSGD